jgi:site-specific DNA recombinase
MSRTQAPPVVRCAVYVRKSSEEGLHQEFNSLEAQRESAEAYVASQRHEGWVCLPHRYDDGGFTGGNMDRPSLQKLIADIEAGRIDCVVVYKVDRLSRSLLDFTRLMEVFDKHRVSFVSVTQQFNTATSMGRLVLNVLLSFAQFEREIIAERTRDKMSAMRRKGKWLGGLPPLGYDVDPNTRKLVLNVEEAARVKAIFEMYREEGSLLPVVQELEKRGWHGKQSTTSKGSSRGGKLFTRTSLYRLLTNVIYTGQVLYQNEVFAGEHPAIITQELFDEVRRHLHRNGRTGGARSRNQFGALLKGLLRCKPCNCAMTPTHTAKGDKRYRYYLCSNANKRGRSVCPTKTIPAGTLEQYVVDRIRQIGRDPELVQDVISRASGALDEQLADLRQQHRKLQLSLGQQRQEMATLSESIKGEYSATLFTQREDLQQRIVAAESQLQDLEQQSQRLRENRISEDDARQALAQFDQVWDHLTPAEQVRLVELVIKQVEYDGQAQMVSLTFHATGIKTLAQETA